MHGRDAAMGATNFKNLQEMRNYLGAFMGTRDNRRDKVAIICAHHPIARNSNSGKFSPAIKPRQEGSFGYFTEFTAKLGARLLAQGIMFGVETKIALIVDDHSMVGEPEWFFMKDAAAAHGAKKPDSELARIVNGVMEARASYTLPECLKKWFITEKNMVFSNESGKYVFWESDYRLKFGREYPDEKIGCAGEVNLIFRELAEKGFNNVIAFFPLRCQGPVCHAATEYNEWRQREGNGAIKQTKLIVTLDTEPQDEIVFYGIDDKLDRDLGKHRVAEKIKDEFAKMMLEHRSLEKGGGSIRMHRE